MDSLPKSRYGRFIHPGLLPVGSLDIAAPAGIHDSCQEFPHFFPDTLRKTHGVKDL